MFSDSGRITPEEHRRTSEGHRRTGDPSSSRQETTEQRWDRYTRLSRSQTEGPESSQGESASEAHYRRMQNTAKELGIRVPDQKTPNFEILARKLLARMRDKDLNFHASGYLSAYLEDPSQGKLYRREHHHELDYFAHAVMFTDILEGGVDPLLSQVRESDAYRNVMNTFFREWKKTLEDEGNKGLREATALEKWHRRGDSTEGQLSFEAASTKILKTETEAREAREAREAKLPFSETEAAATWLAHNKGRDAEDKPKDTTELPNKASSQKSGAEKTDHSDKSRPEALLTLTSASRSDMAPTRTESTEIIPREEISYTASISHLSAALSDLQRHERNDKGTVTTWTPDHKGNMSRQWVYNPKLKQWLHKVVGSSPPELLAFDIPKQELTRRQRVGLENDKWKQMDLGDPFGSYLKAYPREMLSQEAGSDLSVSPGYESKENKTTSEIEVINADKPIRNLGYNHVKDAIEKSITYILSSGILKDGFDIIREYKELRERKKTLSIMEYRKLKASSKDIEGDTESYLKDLNEFHQKIVKEYRDLQTEKLQTKRIKELTLGEMIKIKREKYYENILKKLDKLPPEGIEGIQRAKLRYMCSSTVDKLNMLLTRIKRTVDIASCTLFTSNLFLLRGENSLTKSATIYHAWIINLERRIDAFLQNREKLSAALSNPQRYKRNDKGTVTTWTPDHKRNMSRQWVYNPKLKQWLHKVVGSFPPELLAFDIPKQELTRRQLVDPEKNKWEQISLREDLFGSYLQAYNTVKETIPHKEISNTNQEAVERDKPLPKIPNQGIGSYEETLSENGSTKWKVDTTKKGEIIEEKELRDAIHIQDDIEFYKRALEAIEIPNDKSHEKYPIRERLEVKIHTLERELEDPRRIWKFGLTSLMNSICKIYDNIEQSNIPSNKKIKKKNTILLHRALSILNKAMANLIRIDNLPPTSRQNTINIMINQCVRDITQEKERKTMTRNLEAITRALEELEATTGR